MDEINLRNYAHLGDAVWELFIREQSIEQTSNTQELHEITTAKVNGKYQSNLLKEIENELTEEEQDLKRRARNMPVPVGRRGTQSEYRQATAFEALIGYWYRNDKNRLLEIFEKIKKI